MQLGRGFTVKGGRFRSAIGYQNPIHQHAWDFQDAPLAYKAFLGGRLNDDGVQLKWVAPSELLVELGSELGRGRSFPATDPNKNGAGAWTLFGHVGGDFGASTAWRAGLSHLRTSPRERTFDDVDTSGNPVTQSFTGSSRLWIADFVMKWAPDGNSTITNFKLQGEYFRRSESGELNFNNAMSGDYASRQSGWYLQGVYQFMPQWRVGYRYDSLNAGSTNIGLVDSGMRPAADFPVLAALNIFTCEPEWGALAKELAGDKASIYSATTALQDPHRVEARPSLIARIRSADLLVCSGSELEIGWIPLLLTQS